jgi:predicted ATPase
MTITIDISNLGPIRLSSADLSRLTVLVGPNNSGKSVLATVAYAALSSNPTRGPLGPRTYRSSFRLSYSFRDAILMQDMADDEPKAREIAKESKQLFQKLADGEDIVPEDIPPGLARLIERTVEFTLNSYAEALTSEIERCFGSKLSDLVRIQSGRRQPASFSISHGTPKWRVDVRAIRGSPKVDITQSINPLELLPDSWRAIDPITRDRLQAFRQGPITAGLDTIVRLASNRLFQEFPHAVAYLPAARSGILQSHRALASFVVGRAPLAGIEEMDIPRITGVVSDFIIQLLTLEARRRKSKAFHEIAETLEASVLDGEIQMDSGPTNYPEISYRRRNVSLPLHRTSSMVSELAPVVLYLRYLLSPADLLIIEEPESHLHPESQIRLARAVVSLVGSGLRVMLTTHSDYFLQQLSNSIVAAQVNEAATKPRLPAIEARNVSAYLFAPQPDDRGTVVGQLSVTSTEGISDQDFARVAEAQYEQTVQLDRLAR